MARLIVSERLVGDRYSTVAESSLSISVRAAIWYTSDFPEAVPVAMTTSRPAARPSALTTGAATGW